MSLKVFDNTKEKSTQFMDVKIKSSEMYQLISKIQMTFVMEI